MNSQMNLIHANTKNRETRESRSRKIGTALGKLFSPVPSTGARGPASPGGEGRLIS